MSVWADSIRRTEKELGNRLIEEAPWLFRNEWTEIIVSEDARGRVRLVLLDALLPGNGAFTRLVNAVLRDGKTVIIVEPTGSLVGWCKKHGWRKRVIARGTTNVHEIWYSRPSTNRPH